MFRFNDAFLISVIVRCVMFLRRRWGLVVPLLPPQTAVAQYPFLSAFSLPPPRLLAVSPRVHCYNVYYALICAGGNADPGCTRPALWPHPRLAYTLAPRSAFAVNDVLHPRVR